MNLVAGEVVDSGGQPTFVSQATRIPVHGRPVPPGPATLGIRCEHVHEEADGPIAGSVVAEEYLGNASHVHLQTPIGRLVMRAASGARRSRGTAVRLRLDPAQISVFATATEKRL